MTAGERITAPRCREPVGFRDLRRPREDLDPVCWRPAGHAEREQAAGRPVRHLSYAAWRYDLERSRRNNEDRRRAARMSDPAVRVRS